jgi:hypothetical protein
MSLLYPAVSRAVDKNGNYTEIDFDPPGNPDSPYILSSWKVVSANLYCRIGPGITKSILHTFKKDDAIRIMGSEGNKDNYGYLLMDDQDKPWVKIYLTKGSSEGKCFVRANRAYIAPVLKRR